MCPPSLSVLGSNGGHGALRLCPPYAPAERIVLDQIFQTAEKTRLRKLAARSARVLRWAWPFSSREGAGKAGYRLIPMAPVRKKCTGQEPQV